MPTFTMPQLGESDVEGTVLRWLKQPGEHVRAEEPLVEVETEKVNVEIPSPFEGTLTSVYAAEGETVPVGAPLALIGEEAGAAMTAPAPPAPAPVLAAAPTVPASANGASNGASAPAAEPTANRALLQQSLEEPPVAATTPGGIAGPPAEDAGSPPAPALAADGAVASSTPSSPAPVGAARNGHGVANGAAPPLGEAAGRYSPAVLRLAQEHGLDLSVLRGSGLGGRITRKDVVAYVEARVGGGPAAGAPARSAVSAAAVAPAASTPTSSAAPTAPAASAAAAPAVAPTSPPVGAPDSPAATAPAVLPAEPVAQAAASTPSQPAPAAVGATAPPPTVSEPTPVAAVTPPGAPARPTPAPAADDEQIITPSATRLTIARNMTRAAAIPSAWMAIEVDVTGLVALRAARRAAFREREGIDLTYLPFAMLATIEALREQPLLNSQWRDDQIVLKRSINLSVAVGTDDGLAVPVIAHADRLSLVGLAHAVSDLATRARARKLRLEDVQGGTFTIDNTGVFGSTVSRPIINPPQCAILTTEAIVKRVVVHNDAIAIRSMMNCCIAFDHRIVDGTEVGAFMQAVKRRLEAYDPDSAVL